MEKWLLPKTKGLLVSMAQRDCHFFVVPLGTVCSLGNQEFKLYLTCEQKQNLIRKMSDIYDSVESYAVMIWELPKYLQEEITGQGFYNPEMEEEYAEFYPEEK